MLLLLYYASIQLCAIYSTDGAWVSFSFPSTVVRRLAAAAATARVAAFDTARRPELPISCVHIGLNTQNEQ